MHRGSLVSPLLRAVKPLNKSVALIGYKAVLVRQEIAGL
jgi:hypothetical protein